MRRDTAVLASALAALIVLAGCTSVIAGSGGVSGLSVAAAPSAEPTAPPEPEPDPAPVLLSVFTYHHVKPNPDNFIAISPATFEAHLQTIAQLGYTPITAAELRAHLLDGAPLPPKPMMITFDDGWANQVDHAVPLLEKYGYHATFFVYPKVLGAGSFMSAADAARLKSSGHDVQSHTWGHMPVVGKPGESAEAFAARFNDDFQRTGSWFTSHLGAVPDALAYPYGHYDTYTASVLAPNDIALAFTTDEGVNVLGSVDPLRIKRFSIFKADTPESFAQRLSGLPLTVTEIQPAPGDVVPGASATVSGRIVEPVDRATVEVLWDNEVVATTVEARTDGSIAFSTAQGGKQGFHWVALRARDASGQAYYQGWGVSLR